MVAVILKILCARIAIREDTAKKDHQGSFEETLDSRRLKGTSPERFSVESIVGSRLEAIKTTIKYHRVFTNERSVRWLQARTKPWNTHEEQTVLRFGDRDPPESRILPNTTRTDHLARDRRSSKRNRPSWGSTSWQTEVPISSMQSP